MLQIAICDNNINEASLIEEQLLRIQQTSLIQITISVYFNPSYLLNNALRDNHFDMIYLGISTKNKHSLSVASNIRISAPSSMIILISSYDILAIDVIDIEPSGLIKNPSNCVVFDKCFFKCYNRLLTQKIYFEYKFNKIIYKLYINKIMYFESVGRKIIIVTTDKRYQFYSKLNSIENELKSSPETFIRIHQSFLVNIFYIEKINVSKVCLTDGTILHISPDKQKYLKDKFKNLFQFKLYSSDNFRIFFKR